MLRLLVRGEIPEASLVHRLLEERTEVSAKGFQVAPYRSLLVATSSVWSNWFWRIHAEFGVSTGLLEARDVLNAKHEVDRFLKSALLLIHTWRRSRGPYKRRSQ